MAKLGTEEKRLFVIASGQPARIQYFAAMVTKHIANSVIFTASDGFEALFKMENTPPHVLISDMNLPKMNALELTSKVFANSKISDVSVIIVSEIPDKEHFVDQVVTGQIQFLTAAQNELSLTSSLTKALNRLADEKDFSYHLRFLAPNEVLFRDGDQAQSVYIVKRGEMNAFKGEGPSQVILGQISPGEFVGEMAHINGEPRSATVQAISDCELIEIPMGTLDMVLFSKPAWSKALVATLSRRLKRSNQARAQES